MTNQTHQNKKYTVRCSQCGHDSVVALVTVELIVSAQDAQQITKDVLRKRTTSIASTKPNLIAYACCLCSPYV